VNASASPDVGCADGCDEGWLQRLVAEGLAAGGVDVRPAPGSGEHLVIAWAGGRCELTVEDCGQVHWDFRPPPGEAADPRRVADLATALLTGQAASPAGEKAAMRAGGSTLMGRVGRELRARGLAVHLNVFADQEALNACVDVTAVNPGDQDQEDPQGGEICVTDDGWLSWTRDFSAGHKSVTWHPTITWRITDPEGLAADIVAAVTRTLRDCLPALPHR
jgi:hypothetical protein